MSDGHHHHHHHGENHNLSDWLWNQPSYLMNPPVNMSPPKADRVNQSVQNSGNGGHTARKLPFSSKIIRAIIIGAPLLYLAHAHLDYSSETHPPKDDNPVSYLTYGLKHADKDITSATHTVGKVSDHIMSGLEDRPVPTPAENSRTTAPVRTIGSQYPIDLCVPANLVDNQSWDRPAPGSKMAAFRGALRAFILASGNPNVQYRVREGAFESFNAASRPESLVYGVRAGAPCPPEDYRYTIPVVR